MGSMHTAKHSLTSALLASAVVASLLLGTTTATSIAATPPEATRNYNLGIDAYNQGDYLKARQYFDASVASDPTFADAYFNLGSVYYQMGNYAKSSAAFLRVLQLAPSDSAAQYSLALVYERQGLYPAAIQLLKQLPPSDMRYTKAQEKIVALNTKIAAERSASLPAGPRILPGTQPTGSSAMAKPVTPVVSTTPKPAPAMPPAIKTPIAASKLATGFFGPTGLAVDTKGTLFVANYSKNAIYKVDAKGTKTVFVAAQGLNGPVGLVIDPLTQDLYAANHLAGTVSRITQAGKISTLTLGLKKPYNLVLDSATRILYVSEQETNSVAKIQLPK